MILLLFFYLIGGAGSLLKRATLSADNKHTPWASAWDYLMGNFGDALINLAVSLGLFITVWRNTTFLTTILVWFGVGKDVSVPLNPFTAAIFGVFSEQVTDFIISKGSKLFPQSTATQPQPPQPPAQK